MNSRYSLTGPISGVSYLSTISPDSPNLPLPGSYNNGLFSIVDETDALRLLKEWSWLISEDCGAILTTGFGTVYFWKPGVGVMILDTMLGEVDYTDKEWEWFLDEYLVHPSIIDEVLRTSYFEELVETYRPLKYGETFVLQPFVFLGGTDKIENYTIGATDVFLSIVSQMLNPNSD